jgi:pyruvate,water dikinase
MTKALTRVTGEADRATAGGKAAGLAVLLRAGVPIPDTWVVPVDADPADDELRELGAVAPRWAVRSSATVEDGSALSYAGMFTSELDVPVAELSEAIDRVRASAVSGRVAAYRERTGGGAHGVEMAVLLQPFYAPVRSGLWLGRGLEEGRLEWVTGSGEALVSGSVIPAWEEWTSAGCTADSGDSLLESEGKAVGEACAALQRALGVPADLEFAILDSGLVWLQFRPMTTALTDIVRRTESLDGVVHGTAASSGTANGRALWLRDVADPRWEPGTVLLTEQTDPDWVPLMAEAAALVTAEGGMLCHAAIVARELGVPCVTGVGSEALARLSTVEFLRVDGTAGTVSVR